MMSIPVIRQHQHRAAPKPPREPQLDPAELGCAATSRHQPLPRVDKGGYTVGILPWHPGNPLWDPEDPLWDTGDPLWDPGDPALAPRGSSVAPRGSYRGSPRLPLCSGWECGCFSKQEGRDGCLQPSPSLWNRRGHEQGEHGDTQTPPHRGICKATSFL